MVPIMEFKLLSRTRVRLTSFVHLKKGIVKRLFLGAFALAGVLALAGFCTSMQAQSFSVLYTFTGTPDGSEPGQANLLDVNGTLYGTTYSGGAYGFGMVFKFDRKGQETVLYSFTGGTDGANPSAGVVRDAKGNLYGTTYSGGDLSCTSIYGTPGCGVVFKLDTAGTETALYSFTGGTDGGEPQGLVIDNAGNLYGITFFGGSQTCPFGSLGCGVVYKVDTSGKETVLYTFQDGTDGGEPNGFVTMDSAGNLYGATISGGDLSACSGQGGCGVIFKLDTSGKETVLYTFTGGADGAVANGGFLMDAKGNLYGTTNFGGDLSCSNNPFYTGCGVVFEVTAAGTERVLHTFKGKDGANPTLGLVQDAKGNFYSTTEYGGAFNLGTVFELTAKGTESVLHSFTGLADGEYPDSGLTIDAKGNLFSNTLEGGDLSCSPPYGCGTLFRVVP
jgi:uncharacterized repeat protein (TIGR03803 family)